MRSNEFTRSLGVLRCSARAFKPRVRGSSPRAGTIQCVQVRLTCIQRPSADVLQTFG